MAASVHGRGAVGWALAVGFVLGAAGAQGQGIIPDAQVLAAAGNTLVYGTQATFGPRLDDHGTIMRAQSTESFGCDRVDVPPDVNGMALIVARGNCTFVRKAMVAEAAGAAAMLVFDSVRSMYWAGDPNSLLSGNVAAMFVPSCNVDCRAGSSRVPIASLTVKTVAAGIPGVCTAGGMCSSGLCAFPPGSPVDSAGTRQVCCVVSDDVAMSAGEDEANLAASVHISSIFLTLNSALTLAGAWNQTIEGEEGRAAVAFDAAGSVIPPWVDTTIQLALRPAPTVDGSAVVIWALGCAAVVIAAWVSAAPERAKAVAAAAAANAGEEDGARAAQAHAAPAGTGSHGSPLRITWWQGCSLVLTAAVVLVALFIMLKFGVPIVYIILAPYTVAAAMAVVTVLILPTLTRWAPVWSNKTLCRTNRWGGLHVTVGHASSAVGAAMVVGLWLTFRQQPWSWVPQDVLAVLVCCMFLSTLRLRTLRDAAIIFGAFFLYDIFMVFATAYLIGSSVMVDVATAGAPKPMPNWACYCRQNPDDVASCGPGEFMPILFRVPHLNDYRGGYAMLGLGDVVLPGLLLSLALRFDYHQYSTIPRGKVGYWYFVTGVAGYCLGLAMANVAVALMEVGQPALLYLCPCVFGPVYLMARTRRELDAMWTGSPVVDVAGGGSLGELVEDEGDGSGGEGGSTLTANASGDGGERVGDSGGEEGDTRRLVRPVKGGGRGVGGEVEMVAVTVVEGGGGSGSDGGEVAGGGGVKERVG